MARIVLKFGGTSVGDTDRIKNVARKVKAEVERGNEVAVVVSAMSGATNQLVNWVNEIAPLHDAREYDVVVASGEQVTAGLLAMTLRNMGVKARSWMSLADPDHDRRGPRQGAHRRHRDRRHGRAAWTRARCRSCRASRACRRDGRITTLGRGGSDTSAVALAAALKADRCDIYTDVDGVYTTDPRIVEKARKLDQVSYEEMLEMASLGAKVLQTRSVELAMAQHVRVQVLSSFDEALGSDRPGTHRCATRKRSWTRAREVSRERRRLRRDEAKITVTACPTIRASRRRSSARWPTPTSTST